MNVPVNTWCVIYWCFNQRYEWIVWCDFNLFESLYVGYYPAAVMLLSKILIFLGDGEYQNLN